MNWFVHTLGPSEPGLFMLPAHILGLT
uniref:Uncharacterized protein n=1 Tax=Rhizophora mucronata TaxID=61149 RepID=A0A2P2MPX3_RHIMU